MSDGKSLINPALVRVGHARLAREETQFYITTHPQRAKELRLRWEVFVLASSHPAWKLYLYDLARLPIIPLRAA